MGEHSVSGFITRTWHLRAGRGRNVRHRLGGLVLAAFALIGTPAIAQDRVFLQSELSGNYVRVTPEGWLWADAVSVTDRPESVNRLFRMDQHPDHITLWSLNGRFVRAGVTQDTLLAAVSDALSDGPGGWERFSLTRHPDGTVSLRPMVGPTPHYVRAGVGPHSALAAVSEHVGGWERFRIGRMSEATFGGDLEAAQWCYLILDNKLVIFPQIRNTRPQDWHVPAQGTYFVALGSTNGSLVTSAGRERRLEGYPKLAVPGRSVVTLRGVAVDYSPNWRFSLGGWGFAHDADQNPSNNREQQWTFENVLGAEFIGDGPRTNRRCGAQPSAGWW